MPDQVRHLQGDIVSELTFTIELGLYRKEGKLRQPRLDAPCMLHEAEQETLILRGHRSVR